MIKMVIQNGKLILHDKEKIRYFFSGISAFLVDNAVLLFVAYTFFSNDTQNDVLILGFLSASKTISAAVGNLVSFTLNRQWAFEATGGHVAMHALKFLFVMSFNYLFAVVLYTIFSQIAFQIAFLSLGIAKLTANIATEGVKMITTYFLYKYFVFRDKLLS